MKEYKVIYDEYRKICKKINRILEDIERWKIYRKHYYLYPKKIREKYPKLYKQARKEAPNNIKFVNEALHILNDEHIKLSKISREYKKKLKKLSK